MNSISASSSGALPISRKERQQSAGRSGFVEQLLCYHFTESRVLIGERLVEPLERFIGVAAERVDLRRDSDQQPREDGVSGRNLVDIAPLEFGEKIKRT